MAGLNIDGSLKFDTEDINDFLKKSPRHKNSTSFKRNKKHQNQKDENNAQLLNTTKIKTVMSSSEINNGYIEKVLNNMNRQIESKKEGDNKLLRSLTEILKELEAQYKTLKDNEETLKHLTTVSNKCIQQNVAAQKERLKSLKEIYMTYKQRSEEMNIKVQEQNEILGKELEDDIDKLIEKLTSNAKHQAVESMRRSVFHAIQENF